MTLNSELIENFLQNSDLSKCSDIMIDTSLHNVFVITWLNFDETKSFHHRTTQEPLWKFVADVRMKLAVILGYTAKISG